MEPDHPAVPMPPPPSSHIYSGVPRCPLRRDTSPCPRHHRARRPRSPPWNSRPPPRSDAAWTRSPRPSPYSRSPSWSSPPTPRHSPPPHSFWPERSGTSERVSLVGGPGARRRSRPPSSCRAPTRSSCRWLSPTLVRLPSPGLPRCRRPARVGAPTRRQALARRLGECPASPAAPRFRRRPGEAVSRAPRVPRSDAATSSASRTPSSPPPAPHPWAVGIRQLRWSDAAAQPSSQNRSVVPWCPWGAMLKSRSGTLVGTSHGGTPAAVGEHGALQFGPASALRIRTKVQNALGVVLQPGHARPLQA